MGQLLYGSPPERIQIDDRVLSHLRLVTLAKLRRGESFAANFEFDSESGSGRTTLWLSPHSTLSFRFDGSRRPPINKAWLDALMVSANSPDGLVVVAEPHHAPETHEMPTMQVHRGNL
ncbi:MAG TPA: ATP-dependent DNA ligase [Rhodoglobus sp.]|nr:ATP-dependent DNA ligase [Rhodoglobus sp.]